MADKVRTRGNSQPSQTAHPPNPAAGPRPALRIRVLDDFAISVAGVDFELPPTGQHLIAYLAISGRSVTRRTLVGHLWLDCDAIRGLARLRNVLWKVNSIVADLVAAGELRVQLHPAAWVDLEVARDAATRLLASEGYRSDPSDLALLQHDILPEWDEEWLDVERPAFTVLRVRALERIARRSLEDSRYFEAEQSCRAIIAAEPFRESARLLLAEVRIAEGNVGQAFNELAEFTQLLNDELGIAPNHDIQELVAAISGPRTGLVSADGSHWHRHRSVGR